MTVSARATVDKKRSRGCYSCNVNMDLDVDAGEKGHLS